MALYLYRRDRVPGWQVGSSMIFIAFVEVYHLLIFSSIGVATRFDLVQRASIELPLDRIFPAIFIGAACYLVFHLLYFSGRLLPGFRLRDREILHTFRKAAPWQYAATVLLKAPNLIAAVGVYTVALRLFQVEVSFGQLLAFLPVIFLAAALPQSQDRQATDFRVPPSSLYGGLRHHLSWRPGTSRGEGSGFLSVRERRRQC